MKRIFAFLAVCLVCAQSFILSAEDSRTPLEVIRSIGDKLIENTPFQYRLITAPNKNEFSGMQTVDFSRAYGAGQEGTAYAYTNIVCETDFNMPVQIEHNDGCKVWLNDEVIYTGQQERFVTLSFDERSVELRGRMVLPLKKGVNTLLVKSTTTGGDWVFYMQPEPDKGAVDLTVRPAVSIGLGTVPNIDAKIAGLTNWLICGVFENTGDNPLNQSLPVEHAVGQWGKMFSGKGGRNVTWSIPKVEILGDVINPAEWGTAYNWNYHNGGTAWAMQVLGEISGVEKYDDYATRFCDFHLNGIPFIAYQVDELNAFDCTNHHIYKTPLLDFTLAPSLPFVYKLIKQEEDAQNPDYKEWVHSMIQYSREQIRLPGSTAYTRTTPEVYTTWVDDMFMGIPFLVYASIYSGDESLMQDAVSQVFDFNEQVWDKEAGLYMHAKYASRDVKLPHWSRANGWGIWAVSELLMNLPETDAKYKALLKHYRRHIKNIVKYQNEKGFWYNVLEYPQSREEVSGTAIFTMAIARGIRLGWLDRTTYLPIVEKAWDALKTQIDTDGTVYNICYGTMCSEDPEYYFNRPFYTDDTHGLFAVIFAGIEMHKLLQE